MTAENTTVKQQRKHCTFSSRSPDGATLIRCSGFLGNHSVLFKATSVRQRDWYLFYRADLNLIFRRNSDSEVKGYEERSNKNLTHEYYVGVKIVTTKKKTKITKTRAQPEQKVTNTSWAHTSASQSTGFVLPPERISGSIM